MDHSRRGLSIIVIITIIVPIAEPGCRPASMSPKVPTSQRSSQPSIIDSRYTTENKLTVGTYMEPPCRVNKPKALAQIPTPNSPLHLGLVNLPCKVGFLFLSRLSGKRMEGRYSILCPRSQRQTKYCQSSPRSPEARSGNSRAGAADLRS